jgi:hypothetical protein
MRIVKIAASDKLQFIEAIHLTGCFFDFSAPLLYPILGLRKSRVFLLRLSGDKKKAGGPGFA